MWLLLLCLAASPCLSTSAHAQSAANFQQWGTHLLSRIQAKFWLPERGIYTEEAQEEHSTPAKTAFTWSCCVQLSALTAAARLDPHTYVPLVRQAAISLEPYWVEANGIAGYDVLPQSVPLDRYYDDNCGIGLIMLEAYDVTHNPWYRIRAEQILKFVLSGEDSTHNGGGIYWHEQERKYKAGDVNAAAIVLALRLYQIQPKMQYMTTARRLYDWCNTHLMGQNGLLIDGAAPDGTLNGGQLPSNSATMIYANCLFYEVTQQKSYLQEAERMARLGEARWIDPSTGAVKERAPYAHDLLEVMLLLYGEDNDRHWLTTATRALAFVHEKVRDPDGFYAENWNAAQARPLGTVTLLNQAAVARAFLEAARYH